MARQRDPAPAAYPFAPRSTAALRPGQFWAIPLEAGGFGCGRVLSRKADAAGRVDRRLFLAGLMDWVGRAPPAPDDLAGVPVVDTGVAHIRTILATGGGVLGERALGPDGNEPGEFLDACLGGSVCRGLVYVRPATRADERKLPVLSTYGFLVLKDLAEALARRRPGRRKTGLTR